MLANRLDTALTALIQTSGRLLNPHWLTWMLVISSYLVGWQLNIPLLFGITALGLTLLLLSWLVPMALLNGVTVQLEATPAVKAGEDIPVTLRWTLPFHLSHCQVHEQFFEEPHLHPLSDLTPDQHRRAVSVIPIPTEHRGTVQVSAIELRCAAPFGLVTHQKTLEFKPVTLAISPAPARLEWLPDFRQGQQQGQADNEFQRIRGYRNGDARRHWHTAASARSLTMGSAPVVKEFVKPYQPIWLLVIDTNADSVVGEGSQSTFECAVRLAASVMEYAAVSGQTCYVWADGPAPVRAVAGMANRVNNGLQQLAWIQTDAATAKEPSDYAQSVHQALSAHLDTTVLITVRNQTHPAAIPALPSLRPGLGHLDVLLQEKSFIYPVQAYDEGWFPLDSLTTQLKIHRSTDFERLFRAPRTVSYMPPEPGKKNGGSVS